MRHLFVIVIFCLSLNAFSYEVRLRDDIVLPPEQNQIRLSDFIEDEDIDAFSLTGVGDVIFGYSPLPGKTMKIDVEYVLSKFKRYLDDTGFVLSDIILPEKAIITVYRSVTMPETIEATNSEQRESFEQKGFKAYNREAIESLILDSLAERFSIKFDENLIIDYIDFEQDFFEGEFQKIKLYSQNRSRYMAKIDYTDASERLKYLRIVFDCSWITDIAVCKDDVKRDVLISDAYVKFEKLEYFDYDEPVLFANFPDDQVTKYVIKKDDIIEWRMLTKRSYVLKGQIIKAIFDTGSVEVTSQVELLSNAELGQLVKGKNIDSGITVTGVVETGPVLRIGY